MSHAEQSAFPRNNILSVIFKLKQTVCEPTSYLACRFAALPHTCILRHIFLMKTTDAILIIYQPQGGRAATQKLF
ncbi:MAG: hypothetical protein AAB354_03210 [candidate division KSB1 bacterium]